MPRKQTPKPAKIQKSEETKVSEENWQTTLSQLNFTTVCNYLQCQVASIAEASYESSHLITNFYEEYNASEPKSKTIACVEFNTVISDLENDNICSSSNAVLNDIYKYVVKEIKMHVNGLLTFPIAQTFAKLIKVRLLMAARKMEDADQLEELHRQPILYQPKCANKKKELVKQKTKAKAKPKKQKVKKAGKKGKGKASKTKETKAADLCDANFAYVYSDNKNLLEVPPALYRDIQIPARRIYVVLVGFHDLNLFSELVELGINIPCFVQVRQTDSLNANPCQFWTDFKRRKREDCFVMTITVEPGEVFDEIESAVCSIDDIQRHHVNYIRNLRIHHVICFDCFDNALKVFNGAIKQYPLDALSVPLLIGLLTDEISFQITGSSNLDKLSSKNIDTQKCTRTSTQINGNLWKVFEWYADAESSLIPNETKKCDTTFIVHETNLVRTIANTYKELSERLFDINVEILNCCLPKIVFERCTPEINDTPNKSEMFKKEFQKALCVITLNTTTYKNQHSSEEQQLYPWFAKHTVHEGEVGSETFYEENELKWWYEDLNSITMLQELANAQHRFPCIHKLYLPHRDLLLLKFLQPTDQFGYRQSFWNESIRTPVSLFDFCQFVAPEENKWLTKEDCLFEQVREQADLQLQQQYLEEREKYYPTIKLTQEYLIQCDSIKEKLLLGPQMPADADNKVPKGKGAKGKKDKGAKGKKSGKGKAKSPKGDKKRAKPGIKSTLPLPLKKPERPLTPKLTPRGAKPGEEYSFEASNLGHNYVSAEGFTKAFYSHDGVTVMVEKDTICEKSLSQRLNVTAAGNTFVFNYKIEDVLAKRSFHILLSNGTMICFQRQNGVVNTFPKFKPLFLREYKYLDKKLLTQEDVGQDKSSLGLQVDANGGKFETKTVQYRSEISNVNGTHYGHPRDVQFRAQISVQNATHNEDLNGTRN